MNGNCKVVCGVKKCAGFKYKCKPKSFLYSKTLPLGYKEAHLQRGFASTPPQWGAGMSTRTRFPILHAPPKTSVPQYLYLITISHEHSNYKTQSHHSLDLVSHQINASPPKILATVASNPYYDDSAAGR